MLAMPEVESNWAKLRAIQKNLRSGSTQEQASLARFIKGGTQFFPRGLKLRGGPHMAKLIEARELQQNI
jgi:hypothetical protein